MFSVSQVSSFCEITVIYWIILFVFVTLGGGTHSQNWEGVYSYLHLFVFYVENI